MKAIQEPLNIFDSRNAKTNYKDENYYRSESFKVPPGYVALIELTTASEYKGSVTFVVYREPETLKEMDDCYNNKGIAKKYRQLKCSNSLGPLTDLTTGTQYNDYNKKVVRLGNDYINKEIVEFEYITRPGKYFLMANKSDNTPIEDCSLPTIIELSLIPVTTISNVRPVCNQ